MNAVRKAAMAGKFYPGSSTELRAMVRGFIADARTTDGAPVPKAIIAPHAGYVYSGAIAAEAYARLIPAKDVISRVILLGPCHRVAVHGLAASSADAFATPLGDVIIDKDAFAAVSHLPQVSVVDETHAEEHSLEVHLPFLQEVLGDFSVLPLVVGDATNDEVAEVLDILWGGDETIIVISSDLSHFLDYDTASALDRKTCDAIEAFDPDAIQREQACGRVPVKGLLTLTKRRGLLVETIDLKNSGDTAGSKDRVVGYGAWVFHEHDSQDFESRTQALLDEFGAAFLKVAGASIEHGLKNKNPIQVNLDSFPPPLQETGACFVTLTKDGQLRGCIGSPEAHRPLIQDIAYNASRAAYHDPRFPPVQADEIQGLHVSISILSPQVPMTIADEADLVAQLRPGIDGLVIEDGRKRSLFLPSVWSQLPEPTDFLNRLKLKAGMSVDHWSDTFTAQRFITGEVKQSALEDPSSIWSIASATSE
jgi:MEMO1 family protein